MSLYLGIDSSTQSLTAIVLEASAGGTSIVFEDAIVFDTALPQYATEHGVLPSADPRIAVSPPLLWADALDLMLARIAAAKIDLGRLAAIAGSAQQHGSVYLNAAAMPVLARLDPRHEPGGQLSSTLARPISPIWMDASTTIECREITHAVGGSQRLAEHTGSRAFERFTGPQIRRFYKTDPAAYAATTRVHLVSSFLATLLCGHDVPVDPGDGSGMNLMDLASAAWWPPAVDATAPGLAAKLPAIASASTIAGTLSPYWQARHGLPAARVVVWSGDNPCSLIGSGLIDDRSVAISLGTSDTIFGPMRRPAVDATGTGHVFGAPTGDFMGLTCFANGAIARERVRDRYGLTWSSFSAALDATPPANGGGIMLPWFLPEITPLVLAPGVQRFGIAPDDAAGNVRGVVEAQMLSMALHSRWMQSDIRTIHATGGASANRAILQVMADVFGAEVCQFSVGNSACLGAALRARHADALANGAPIEWSEVVGDLVRRLIVARVQPRRQHHAAYRALGRTYAVCEARAISHFSARESGSDRPL